MSRNVAGTYSLPLPSVVNNTTIDPSWANTTLNDLATEMTDSFNRSGKGAMLATLLAAQGALGGTGGYAFSGESNSGFYRAAVGDLRWAIAGTDMMRLTATGLDLLTAALRTTAANLGLTLKGNKNAADAGTDVIIDTTNLRTTGKLFAVQNQGSTRFDLDPNGIATLGGTTPSLLAGAANTTLTLKGNRSAADTGSDVDADTPVNRTNGNLWRWLNNAVVKARVDFAGKGWFTGLDAGSQVVANVATPVAGTDAANKTYADGQAAAVVSKARTTADVVATAAQASLVSFSVVSGSNYEFDFACIVDSSVATQNIGFIIDGDGGGAAFPTMTTVAFLAQGGNPTPTMVNDNGANPAFVQNVPVTTSKRLVILRGLMRAAANGTVFINFYRNGGSGNVTVYRGASLRVTSSS